MPVRTALLLGALLLPGLASAQQSDDGPTPPEPATEPPAPAALPVRPGAAQPLASPLDARPLYLPPGMEALAGGSWRLRFAEGADRPPPPAATTLAELGRRLAGRPDGRITLLAQASGPADVSTARRISLARALAVKDALTLGGLPATRIDVRPMGRTAEAVDAVDVQPPTDAPPRAATPTSQGR